MSTKSGPDKIREALEEVVNAYLQVDEGRFNWEDWYDRAEAALAPSGPVPTRAVKLADIRDLIDRVDLSHEELRQEIDKVLSR